MFQGIYIKIHKTDKVQFVAEIKQLKNELQNKGEKSKQTATD